MTLTRLFPAGPGQIAVDISAAGAPEQLDALYDTDADEWLRINLVSSVSGSAAGLGDTSESLTNRTDRAILGAIRRRSDVVLVGAASLRREHFPVPRHAALAVLTASGDLTGHGLPEDLEHSRVIVLCPEDAVERVRQTLAGTPAAIISLSGSGGVSLSEAVGALRVRGLRHIVCEGGPSLAAQLLNSGLVDELCLTTAPLVNTNSLPLLGLGEIRERRLRLTQLLVDESTALYARWAVATPPATG